MHISSVASVHEAFRHLRRKVRCVIALDIRGRPITREPFSDQQFTDLFGITVPTGDSFGKLSVMVDHYQSLVVPFGGNVREVRMVYLDQLVESVRLDVLQRELSPPRRVPSLKTSDAGADPFVDRVVNSRPFVPL